RREVGRRIAVTLHRTDDRVAKIINSGLSQARKSELTTASNAQTTDVTSLALTCRHHGGLSGLQTSSTTCLARVDVLNDRGWRRRAAASRTPDKPASLIKLVSAIVSANALRAGLARGGGAVNGHASSCRRKTRSNTRRCRSVVAKSVTRCTSGRAACRCVPNYTKTLMSFFPTVPASSPSARSGIRRSFHSPPRLSCCGSPLITNDREQPLARRGGRFSNDLANEVLHGLTGHRIDIELLVPGFAQEIGILHRLVEGRA
ncbi:MAG: hypothetical protein JWL62_3898, partial [Hyphomicrobiales bacterium]|nr:hypothetical protein [Hyphomicrobiales bacterium]